MMVQWLYCRKKLPLFDYCQIVRQSDMHDLKRRIAAYCARGEHPEREIRLKLERWQLSGDQTAEILSQLRDLKLIDDSRYCRHMTEKCLYEKKWGRERIRILLLDNGIAEELITKALAAIPEEEYLAIMEQAAGMGKDPASCYRRLVRRGFEEEIVNSWLRKNCFLE